MKDEGLYIIHILECIARIERYVGDNPEAALEDRMVYDAVLRNLQTLAEATTRLSEATQAKHTNIRWRDIAGFRNILVHDYLGDYDAEILKALLQHHLPVLKAAIISEQQTRGLPHVPYC